MSEHVIKIEYSQELMDKVIKEALKTIQNKYFLIRCDNQDILHKLRGYMSDGGGEYGILEAFDHNIEYEDIRDDKGNYIGLSLFEKENEE